MSIIKLIDFHIIHDDEKYSDFLDKIQEEYGLIDHIRLFKENKMPKLEIFFKKHIKHN